MPFFHSSYLVELLTLATGAFGMAYNSTSGELTYTFGIFGPMTSISQQYIAAAVAFDIDFRKHFEHTLVAAFGDPVVNIPNLNQNLRIQTIIGTSDSDPTIGLQTVADWAAGVPPFPVVDTVVGGAHSSITLKAATLCEAFKIPQVSWGATNPELSDKALHPFFARTIPPDSLQGAALWAWIQHFRVPSVAAMYADEPYGLGLFQSLEAAAGAAGGEHRVDAVELPHMSGPSDFNSTEAEEALALVRRTGSRFIVLCMSSSAATFLMYSMEQAEMLYGGSYQIMGTEGADLQQGQLLAPSHGVPVGFQKLHPKARGSNFPLFADMWESMTAEQVYGAEARARYLLNDMKVSVENASAPVLQTSDFVADAMDPGVGFLFDAAYTMAIAINELLNQGVPPEAVKGGRLVEQLRHVAFEGVTGNVSFDAHLDRLTAFELWNARVENITHVHELITHIGNIDSGSVELLMNPMWSTGNSSATPPAELTECRAGFEKDVSLDRCLACIPGVGCGYDPEMGFPLGVVGDVAWQHVMNSAVLFDLDFRKNFEPALVERFGPPLIRVPNLHPDLRTRVLLGNSARSMATGVESTLQWMTGRPELNIPRAAGIVGEFFSFITGPIATNCEVFEVPQISYGATNPDLSNKDVYPFFMRTIPPDSLKTSAIWGFLSYFGIPSMAYAFTREGFGEGLFNSLATLAVSAGQSGRVVGIGVPFDASLTVEELLPYVEQVQGVGTRFLSVTMTSISGKFYRAMELYGVFYGERGYQMFGEHEYYGPDSDGIGPSLGSPVGALDFNPITAGALSPFYLEMWANMTHEDVWGPAAVERYQLDKLLNPPDTQPVFDPSSPPHVEGPLMVDALYTFVFAINNLLNAGLPPEHIRGQLLLDELANTSFEGISGPVGYNENYDRLGDYEILNTQPDENGALGIVAAGIWKSGTNTFEFSTDLYWAGGTQSATVPDALVACTPGQRWDDALELCTFCPLNWFSLGGVGTAATCEACAQGSVSNQAIGSTTCVSCDAGYYRTISDDNCTACPAGYFGASPGQSACEQCPVGEYASSQGLSECDVCGAGRPSEHRFTTMIVVETDGDVDYSQIQAATSDEQCGCNEHTRLDGAGECIPCTEGMICLGMNDVRVQEGYFAEAIVNGELSIFRCHGEQKRCSGGFPGGTCATGRKGVTCGECQDGMTPKSDGSCTQCGGGDLGPFVILVIVGILALIFTYHIISTQNRVTQSHALLLCAIAIGQLITVCQQLGVVGMLSIHWEEPVKSFMKLIGVLTFNIEVLRLNCVSSQGPVDRFIVKICIIFITIALMVLIHCAYVLLRYKGRFSEHHHALVGAIGTMLMVFNIAVTSTVLEPLQCQDHPNDLWTIRNYPSIVCWKSSDHTKMLFVGTIAFFLVPMNYLVACVAIVREFPARMRCGDEKFLKAFYFLFFRFQPQHYSYVLVTIVRSFLVAAVLVVPDVTSQIFLLQLILLMAYSTTLYWCPWRVKLANLLDALFGGGAVLLVCLASLFIASEEKNFTGIAWLTMVFILGMLIMAPCAIVYGLCRKYLRGTKPFQYFLCHHKNGSGAYTRLLKMHLQSAPKVNRRVFVDSDNLDNLDRLFDYVGNDTSTLLVIRSEAIFTRPYCVGEMCTARLKHVSVVTIALPNSVAPDDEFIAALDSRVQDLHVLTESGMSLDMLAETLVWIRSEPCIHVPDALTGTLMAALVEKLIAKEFFDLHANMNRRSGSQDKLNQSQSLTLYDFSSMEAASTALIMKMCLSPLLLHESEKIPQPMHGGDMHEYPKAMVVICMNGTFDQLDVLRVLFTMSKFQCSTVPVIAEPGFRFPSKDSQAISKRCESAGMDGKEGEAIAGVLASIFKEIAVDFHAQHSSETLLSLGAQNISRRLLSIDGATKTTDKKGSGIIPGNRGSSTSSVVSAIRAASVSRLAHIPGADYQDDDGRLVSGI